MAKHRPLNKIEHGKKGTDAYNVSQACTCGEELMSSGPNADRDVTEMMNLHLETA